MCAPAFSFFSRRFSDSDGDGADGLVQGRTAILLVAVLKLLNLDIALKV